MKIPCLLSSFLIVYPATGLTAPRPIGSALIQSCRKSTLGLREMASSDTDTEETEQTGVFSQEVQDEAKQALASVGWARPLDDGEMTSDDPFVKQIDEGIQRDYGVSLDDLLNPAKVRKDRDKL